MNTEKNGRTEQEEKLAFKVPNDFGDNTHGLELSSISLTDLLTDTMGWKKDVHYRIRGRYIKKENIIVFPLTQYEIMTIYHSKRQKSQVDFESNFRGVKVIVLTLRGVANFR